MYLLLIYLHYNRSRSWLNQMEVVTELTDLTLFFPQDPSTLKDSKKLLDLERTLRCVHACHMRLSVIQGRRVHLNQ